MKFSIFNFQFSNKSYRSYRSYGNSGQAALIATLFLMFISLVLVFAASSIALTDNSVSALQTNSAASFYVAEAGLEDVMHRLLTGQSVGSEEVVILDGGYSTTTIVDIFGDIKRITSRGDISSSIRSVQTDVRIASGATFHYGVQVGDGGILMENLSQVTGNVYSNGPIVGGNKNKVLGDVISAGVSGSVDGAHATGTVYAHTILNSEIDGDAYYQNISNTTVGGMLYPNSPDQPTQELPISDEVIEEWKNEAAVPVISSPCPYKITSNMSIGPAKITCDVEISGDPTLTLSGTLWISGNLDIKNTAIIRLDASYGAQSGVIVVDKENDRITSSKVLFQNSVQFQDSGTEGSYVLVVSQNRSSEGGGSEVAIDIKNSASGDLLVYAGHGEILMQNNNDIREISAYKVHLKNQANVIYEEGLVNMLFSSGPGATFELQSWQEIP